MRTNLSARSAKGRMRIVQTWPRSTEGYEPLQITADRVDCWFVSLATFPTDAESLAVASLSKDERKRATGFYFERRRQCRIRSHAALRLLLGRYLMTAPDARRPATWNSTSVTPVTRCWSASRSILPSELILNWFEMFRTFSQLPNVISRRASSRNCLDWLPSRREGSYVTWTHKEAFVKALGLGLLFPFDSFCTSRQDRPPRLTQADGAVCPDWTIADLAPVRECKAAVAVRQRNVTFHCREAKWPWLLARRGDTTNNSCDSMKSFGGAKNEN